MTKVQLKQLVKEAIQEMTTVSVEQLKAYFSKNPNQIQIKAHLSGDSEVMGGEYMGRELTEDEIDELNSDEDFKSNIKNAKGITHHDAAFGESKGFTKSKLKQIIKEVLSEIESGTANLGFKNLWTGAQIQQIDMLTKDSTPTVKDLNSQGTLRMYTYTLKQPLANDVTVGSMTIPQGTKVITYKVDSSD